MLIPVKSGLSRLVAVAAVLVAVGGCGSAATTSSSPAGASATSSSTTRASAAGAGGSGRCPAAQLVLAYLGGLGATGHGDLGFALRNTGARACHTYGYPAVEFLDRSGRPLPTHVTRRTDDFFGHSPLRALSVAPGGSVSFRLDASHGSGSPGRCPTAAALRVIPPGDTHALRVTITNGAYECGRVIVSPLQPGHTAHP
jgi:hypothetical protein